MHSCPYFFQIVACKGKSWAVGKTKVFLADETHNTLEEARRTAFAGPAIEIQAAYRGWKTRRSGEMTLLRSEKEGSFGLFAYSLSFFTPGLSKRSFWKTVLF